MLTKALEGVDGNANVVMRVSGAPAHTVIAFSYLLIIFYALTLAPICWVYAAEVWSLETRATGMGISAIGNWLFSRCYTKHKSVCELPLTLPRLRHRSLHSTRIPQHPMETLHRFRHTLSWRCHPILVYIPGDMRQDY
jgi:hypothetical protein